MAGIVTLVPDLPDEWPRGANSVTFFYLINLVGGNIVKLLFRSTGPRDFDLVDLCFASQAKVQPHVIR